MLSIVTLISRLNPKFFSSLQELEVPECELIVMLDGIKREDVPLEGAMFIDMKSEGTNPVHIKTRRERIAELMNVAKKYVSPDSTYVLTVEDDTTFDKDAFNKLLPLMENKQVGFVSGVQVGRWGIPYLGAFMMEDGMMKTIPYKKSGTSEVVSCGFYFMLTRQKLFTEAEFESGDFGPDTYYGLNLTDQGFRGLVNYDVPCGHIMKNGEVLPSSDCSEITFVKQDGRWIQADATPFKNVYGTH